MQSYRSNPTRGQSGALGTAKTVTLGTFAVAALAAGGIGVHLYDAAQASATGQSSQNQADQSQSQQDQSQQAQSQQGSGIGGGSTAQNQTGGQVGPAGGTSQTQSGGSH